MTLNQPHGSSDGLLIHYGGSVGSLVLGILTSIFGLFFSGYGSGIFPYRNGSHLFSSTELGIGLVFLIVSFTLLFYRFFYLFERSRKQVTKNQMLNLFGIKLTLRTTARDLTPFSIVQLGRYSGGRNVTYTVALVGDGQEYRLFGTNNRQRMTRDAELVSKYLGLPLVVKDLSR